MARDPKEGLTPDDARKVSLIHSDGFAPGFAG